MLHRVTHRRRGASALEFALISPALMALLIGLVVGGLGIFRFHQVSSLAREAARYASVHGLDYSRETDQPAATQESIRDEVVLARSAGLRPELLICTVTWDESNAPRRVLADMTVVNNVVIVTVSYQWVPEAYFGGIRLSSTSRMPMSF
jgi:Flp pilus assembly protein TadG